MDFDVAGGPLVEESLRIDLAEPAIRRIVTRRSGAGSVNWWRGGEHIADVGYVWNGSTLTLRFCSGGVVQHQCIRTLRAPAGFGGARLWFVCPSTATPVRVLLLPAGARLWAGRRAHGAVYTSQRRREYQGFAAFEHAARRAEARDRRNTVRRVCRASKAAGA